MKPFLILFSISFASAASAYTPPTGFVLNQMLKNRDELKQLYLEGKVTDLKVNAVFKERLWIHFDSGKIAAQYLDANDEILGKVDSEIVDLSKLGKAWLGVALDPNGARFRKDLEELGLLPKEKSVATLSRIGTKVTWSWQNPGEIQVYKDDFNPAQIRFKADEIPFEIQFKDYSSASAAVRVPKTVVIREKDQDVFRFDLRAIKINVLPKYEAQATPVSSQSVQEWVKLVR